jgi:hypothetical protein
MSAPRTSPNTALVKGGVFVESPEIEVLGDAVLIRGQALLDNYWLVRRGVEAAEVREGIAPSARVAGLLAAQRRALSASEVPVTELRAEGTSASSGAERIGSGEAADLMGMTERWARHLAPELGGHKVAGRWTFDKQLVLARANDREEA